MKEKIFICKLSDQFPEQFHDDFYAAGEEGNSWYGGIKVGDYVFPVFNSKIEKLWKVKEYSKDSTQINKIGSVRFDTIKKYDKPIELAKTFARYNHFNVDLNLLNKTFKQTVGKGFFEISTDNLCPKPENIDFSEKRNFYISLENPLMNIAFKNYDIRILIDNINDFNIKDIQNYNNGKWETYKILFDLYKKSNKNIYNSNELYEYSKIDNAPKKEPFLFETIKSLKSNGIKKIDSPLALYDNLLVGRKQTAKSNKLNYWRIGTTIDNINYWDEMKSFGKIGIGWSKIGDLNEIEIQNKKDIEPHLNEDYNNLNNKKALLSRKSGEIFNFYKNIHNEDIILAQEGHKVLGIGVVKGDYSFDKSKNFAHQRKVDWRIKSTDLKNSQGSQTTVYKLTDINLLKSINDLLKMNTENNYMNDKRCLNQILYGPPGTGKTYQTILKAAEILEEKKIVDYQEALKIFKENLHDRIEFITFHQNYSYEDFIQGLRPDTENGDNLTFEKKDGVFKKISDRALENLIKSEKAPDEINKRFVFEKALENLKDQVIESDKPVKINETAYFTAAEDDAFRYTGDNWTLHNKGFNGFRMKYSDLYKFFDSNVQSRKDIKDLNNISGLARQHASYFFKVYEIVKGLMQDIESTKESIKKKNYVIIIDEINRANISRVFGELITLIEPDKRSHGDIPMEAKLPSGDIFIVPSNLHIIGTMNTADKSIALLDIALRRRFEFEAMYPKYEIEGHEIHDVEILKRINKQIIELKGHDFQIGHSYFMNENKDLVERMNKKVIPLLLEYFMNDKKEVEKILDNAGLEIEDDSWPLRIIGEKND